MTEDERRARARARHEQDQRFAAEHPDAALRRREFLARTAAIAGAAGLASTLPASTLMAEAAQVQGRVRLPPPRAMPLDTVVVLMMENRSFDHYFGWHPGAEARNEGLVFPAPGGKTVPAHRLPPDFQGCDHPDPDHSWSGGRFQMNGGRNDGFVLGSKKNTSDEFAAGYFLEQDLGFIAPAARAYTLFDHWFCSIMASTYPNRHYQLGAQNGGQKNNLLPPRSDEQTGFTWETIFDRALAKGVSARYYVSDLPFPALYGQRGISWISPIERYYQDAADGKLPNIAFVDPPFRDGGGGDGVSADEHPLADIRLGQAFMSDVVHAFIASPQYRRGALFVNYDEWGGFFDHVPPPRVPDDRDNPRDLEEDWGQMGFRVPAVAVSPWTRGGRVAHATLGHESILKLIAYRWQLGHLNRRHRYAYNVGRTFDWRRPKLEPPVLPDPAAVAAVPCSLGGNPGGTDAVDAQDGDGGAPRRALARPKPHDLVELETSGLLERLGYTVPRATYARIFRSPDALRRAVDGG